MRSPVFLPCLLLHRQGEKQRNDVVWVISGPSHSILINSISAIFLVDFGQFDFDQFHSLPKEKRLKSTHNNTQQHTTTHNNTQQHTTTHKTHKTHTPHTPHTPHTHHTHITHTTHTPHIRSHFGSSRIALCGLGFRAPVWYKRFTFICVR